MAAKRADKELTNLLWSSASGKENTHERIGRGQKEQGREKSVLPISAGTFS